jgi:hypothetical protein
VQQQMLYVIHACVTCLHVLQTDKTKALFQVSVAFEPHGMTFTPNETAILDEINANTLEGIVSVAQVILVLWCDMLSCSRTCFASQRRCTVDV